MPRLTDRIIMSPSVALLLTNALQEYETRFGSLGAPVTAAPSVCRGRLFFLPIGSILT